ncbi:MAG: CehA/McbA family metallohydrolase [Candidatus Bathyarchaeota archaeon]|nr:CehA/McbA family metallohydrolase [Candidatus Bathyarchaeota archaeon]
MHVHTKYSFDAFITPKELVIYSKKQGLDGVAITDHDTINGLQEFSKIKSLLVIPGAEITTKQGHVLAINVNTTIKTGLSFVETIDQIHDAGGLAIVAHPTAFFKGIAEEELDQNFDAMEVINSSAVPFSFSVRKNRKMADKLNFPQTGGSDAHYALEVGMAYTVIDAEKEVDEVVKAIKRGAVVPFGRSIPWGVRLKRVFLRAKKR